MKQGEVSPAERALAVPATGLAHESKPCVLQLDDAMNQAPVSFKTIAARAPVFRPGNRRDDGFRLFDRNVRGDLCATHSAGENTPVRLPRCAARDQHTIYLTQAESILKSGREESVFLVPFDGRWRTFDSGWMRAGAGCRDNQTSLLVPSRSPSSGRSWTATAFP